MLEMRHSTGTRDATITVFFDAFCRECVREAEIPRVLAMTTVSESAFYEQFHSKENAVSAFLKDRHAIWMRWFEKEIEARYKATGGGLEIIADVLQEAFEDPKYFGLAFMNIVTEGNGASNGEPFVIAREQREYLRRFLEQLAATMGLQDPGMAASAAVLVINQTIIQTLMTGSVKEVQAARLLFQCIQHA